MEIFVIKLGGSVITDKEKEFSVREDVLDRICRELASTDANFVLVHGGGSFGHPVASKYKITEGYSEEEQLRGFSETHRAMERLNSRVIDALLGAEIPAVPVQTSACAVVEDDQIVSIETRNIEKLLEMGIVPVLYGDSVPDLKKGMTILSGDQLLARLARELNASRVILGTDTDGVYTTDPKSREKAELIPKITPENWENIAKLIDFSNETEDVTGGMKNKVEVLVSLAEDGIDSRVVNALKPDVLRHAIRSDKKVGTNISRE